MSPRARAMPLDSDHSPLASPNAQQRKYVRFDPTINTGHVLSMLVIAASAFGVFIGLRDDQKETKADLAQVKAVAIIERAQTTMALSEIKIEMKEQGKTLGDLKEGIAILRGRAAEPRGGK